MPTNRNQTAERGAALLAALMMLVVVSVIAVFIASATTATANDIQQHTSTQDEYWAAKSMAETVEGSARTDLPTAYDLEMRIARSATLGTALPIFDSTNISVEQTKPVYDPNGWAVTFNADGTISVTGSKVRAAEGATSLFGNLSQWLGSHKSVSITYAANHGYNPTELNLTLNEACRLTPAGGTSEPQYIVQFGIDARSGAGGRVRQTGLITLGPPITLTPDDPCSSLDATLGVAQLATNPTVPPSVSYTLTVKYVRATHIKVTAATEGVTSILYDSDVNDDPNPQTLTLNTPFYSARTVFTLTASNRSPSGATCTVVKQATVQECPPGTFSFTASPPFIARGESSTLNWSVTGADSVHITGPGVNFTGAATGSLVVSPASTATYNLTSTSSGGAGCPGAAGTVTVVVCTNTPQINSFQAQPGVITTGQSTTLSWNVSNADTVSITQGIGNVTTVGQVSVSPQQTTLYTITASSACGIVSAVVTVTVCTGPPSIISFEVNPGSINPGGVAVLSWNVDGAETVRITPAIGTVSSSGQFSVSPSLSTSYTLTAINACGTRTRRLTVSVTEGDPGGGGDGGGVSKIWCDQTVIGTYQQYTRFAATVTPDGSYVSVSGLIVLRNPGGFPCGRLVSYEDMMRPVVWLTVNNTGFQRYDAVSCCFLYTAGPEISIHVTIDRLFQPGDVFADRMSLQGAMNILSSDGCSFTYNYSVSPYARGDCSPRGPFVKNLTPKNLTPKNLMPGFVKPDSTLALALPDLFGMHPLDIFLPRRNERINFF